MYLLLSLSLSSSCLVPSHQSQLHCTCTCTCIYELPGHDNAKITSNQTRYFCVCVCGSWVGISILISDSGSPLPSLPSFLPSLPRIKNPTTTTTTALAIIMVNQPTDYIQLHVHHMGQILVHMRNGRLPRSQRCHTFPRISNSRCCDRPTTCT